MAFPLSTRVTDELINAAIWNADLVGNLNNGVMHLITRKTADEPLASNTTFQPDDQLIAPVLANEVWLMKWMLVHTGTSAADIKYRWTFPTAGFLSAWAVGFEPAGVLTGFLQSGGTSPTGQMSVIAQGATTPTLFIVDLFYTGGANAGNVALEWAQNASDGTATIVRANSTVWGVKLA